MKENDHGKSGSSEIRRLRDALKSLLGSGSSVFDGHDWVVRAVLDRRNEAVKMTLPTAGKKALQLTARRRSLMDDHRPINVRRYAQQISQNSERPHPAKELQLHRLRASFARHYMAVALNEERESFITGLADIKRYLRANPEFVRYLKSLLERRQSNDGLRQNDGDEDMPTFEG